MNDHFPSTIQEINNELLKFHFVIIQIIEIMQENYMFRKGYLLKNRLITGLCEKKDRSL